MYDKDAREPDLGCTTNAATAAAAAAAHALQATRVQSISVALYARARAAMVYWALNMRSLPLSISFSL